MVKKADKSDDLKKMMEAIEKEFGKGSVMQLCGGVVQDVEVISTGSLSLDYAIGVGGVPKGRITEIYGSESSGKTTLGLHLVANCQKVGGIAAYIDAENAVDPKYAKSIGVDVNRLCISQPSSGEEGLEIVDMMVRSGIVGIIVVDSVAALVPLAELEGSMGESHIGLQARLMSQAMRKLSGSISKSNTCVVFINQVREKIGVVFGSPLVTPGGRALKFYSSVRLQISRIGSQKDGAKIIGNKTRVKVVKNKVAAPFKEAEFEIVYGKGICETGELLGLAETYNILAKKGAWYYFGSTKLGQGYMNSIAFLEQETNSKVFASLKKRVLQKLEVNK